MKELGVDGWIHDSCLAIIVSAYSARNIMRDSDIAVNAIRSVAVPTRHPRHHRPHHRRGGAPDALRTEVRVELIPRIPHRREAVAHVPDAARVHDRFRAAMTDADDDVEAIEGELLDGGGEQREAMAIEPLHHRQPPDERR